MPHDKDLAAMQDMLDAARLARDFVTGRGRDELEDDPMLRSSVIYQLLIVGEAAKRVSESTRIQHGGVPWRDIAGMRDRLIHGYHEVDLDEVWRTASRDVATLIDQLERVLPGHGPT